MGPDARVQDDNIRRRDHSQAAAVTRSNSAVVGYAVRVEHVIGYPNFQVPDRNRTRRRRLDLDARSHGRDLECLL